MLLFHVRGLFVLLFICIFSCRALYDWRGVFPCKCLSGICRHEHDKPHGIFPWKLVPRSILSNSNVTYQEHGAVKYF